MSELGDLVSAIGDIAPSASVRFRQGEITAVGLDTVSVDIGASGESVDDIAFMSSYAPTVGDVVWLITDGQDWFVLGQLGQDFTVESLRLRGLDNLGVTGGKFTLQGGVSRPQSSPVATATWPNKPTGWFSNRGYNPRGWFYDSGYWYSTSSLFGGTWNRYSEATNNFYIDKAVAMPANQSPIGGIAVIAGKAYVLVQDTTRNFNFSARYYVYRYNISTGAKEAEFQYLPSATTAVEAYGYRPAIGVKNSNLIIGQARKSDNKIEIREYTTAGTVVGSTIVTNLAATQDIHHISYGSYDFGSPRFVVYANTWNEIKVLSTAGVYVADESFPTPFKYTDIDGIGWDSIDGTFMSTRSDVIYRHSKHTWTAAADNTWWVSHSWFDSSAAGTGQHETLISDPVSFTMSKRAALSVTTPALPAPSVPPSDDDVTGVRIYHGRGSTTPTAANMKREVTDLADGVVSVTYTNLTPVNAANTGVPSAFPGQTPFEIASPDNEIVLKGDGEAEFTKLVTLKDEATSTVWLNAAGTGRLQKPVMLVATRNSTAYSIPNGGERYVNTTHHDITLNTGGFTRESVSGVARYFVPTNGYYRIIFHVGFEENTTGQRFIGVLSSSGLLTFNSTEAVSNIRTYLNCQMVWYLTTTDYLTFQINQTSGGSLGMSVGSRGGQLIIERVSD